MMQTGINIQGVLVICPRDVKKFYSSRSAVPVFGKVVEEMVGRSMLIPVKKYEAMGEVH